MLNDAQKKALKNQIELWWDQSTKAVDSIDDYAIGFAEGAGISHEIVIEYVKETIREIEQSITLEEREIEEMYKKPLEIVNDDVFPEDYYEDPEKTVWLDI